MPSPTAAPSPASPIAIEWHLINKRTKEQRTFEQIELAIEGESRLIGIARDVAAVLTVKGYTFQSVLDVVGNAGNDFGILLGFLNDVADEAPATIGDLLTVLLGVYTTNIDGSTYTDYDADRRYLLQSVNVATLADMIRVFTKQNDYQRLIDSFRSTLTGTMDVLGAGDTGASSEPLPEGQVVSADGSIIALDPETTGIPEPPTRSSETPSEPS